MNALTFSVMAWWVVTFMVIAWVWRHRAKPHSTADLARDFLECCRADQDLEQRKAKELEEAYQKGFKAGLDFDPDEPLTVEKINKSFYTLLGFFDPDSEWNKRPRQVTFNESSVLLAAYDQGNRDGMDEREHRKPKQLDLFERPP